METKLAKIYRVNSKPVIDLITVESKHDKVEWSIDEQLEFVVAFPKEDDPFEADNGRSKDRKLTRKLKGRPTKGHRHEKHYEYTIMLSSGEKVVGRGGKTKVDSPPEMVIQ
jgi:hypothetical protein